VGVIGRRRRRRKRRRRRRRRRSKSEKAVRAENTAETNGGLVSTG
jgi:hypothetical protein